MTIIIEIYDVVYRNSLHKYSCCIYQINHVIMYTHIHIQIHMYTHMCQPFIGATCRARNITLIDIYRVDLTYYTHLWIFPV